MDEREPRENTFFSAGSSLAHIIIVMFTWKQEKIMGVKLRYMQTSIVGEDYLWNNFHCRGYEFILLQVVLDGVCVLVILEEFALMSIQLTLDPQFRFFYLKFIHETYPLTHPYYASLCCVFDVDEIFNGGRNVIKFAAKPGQPDVTVLKDSVIVAIGYTGRRGCCQGTCQGKM